MWLPKSPLLWYANQSTFILFSDMRPFIHQSIILALCIGQGSCALEVEAFASLSCSLNSSNVSVSFFIASLHFKQVKFVVFRRATLSLCFIKCQSTQIMKPLVIFFSYHNSSSQCPFRKMRHNNDNDTCNLDYCLLKCNTVLVVFSISSPMQQLVAQVSALRGFCHL